MSIFTFRKVQYIRARQLVDELVIDGVGQLTEVFEVAATEQHEEEFGSLMTVLQKAADGVRLPDTMHRTFNFGKKYKLKSFECKYRSLRIYGCLGPNGRIIVLGGFKNTQDDDINLFKAKIIQLQEHLNALKK